MEIVDFRKSVESIVSQQNVVTTLLEKNLGTAANGVAVVNDQYLESLVTCGCQFGEPPFIEDS
ncbi:hypothetical protein [Diaphorobacter sp.]|uniref:hypothetical protein n=1 Tax=Diaphorobacter sp. TaxID=1934310 RepID=UPI0028AF8A19|nr:hypothetical protein [Diaphorobacter sp.]